MIKLFLFKDLDGKESTTFTAFIIGGSFSLFTFIVGTFIALFKFTFADIVLIENMFTIVHMGGVDCAAVILSLGTTCTTIIATLGGLYWGRKHTKKRRNVMKDPNGDGRKEWPDDRLDQTDI